MSSDAILDDDDLLKDRLLRSFHRNGDGHLSSGKKHHINAIETFHNAAVLYVYTKVDDVYTLHEHYIYSHDPHEYKVWKKLVDNEIQRIENNPPKGWLGAYGWLTSTIQITPLRTGDLFIKIDKGGATGVRLSFGSRTN